MDSLVEVVGSAGREAINMRLTGAGCQAYFDPAVFLRALEAAGYGVHPGVASLIAAAPDLLATLQFVQADPCFKLLGSVTHDEVAAALAKVQP